jgi:hypothetical protein
MVPSVLSRSKVCPFLLISSWFILTTLVLDIIEEIIEEEIVDETDRYESMHTKRKARRQSTAAIMQGFVSLLSLFI